MKFPRESGIWLITLITVLALGSVILISHRMYRLAYEALNQQLNDRMLLSVQTAVDEVAPLLERGSSASWTEIERGQLQRMLEYIRASFQLENLFIFDRDRRSIADARPSVRVGKAYNFMQIPPEAIETIWSGKDFLDYKSDTESLSFRNAARPLLVASNQIAGGVYAQASLDFDKSLVELRRTWLVSTGVSVGLSAVFIVALLGIQLRYRRLQAAMNRRNRLELIHQLSAGIAHDIKNPLTAILGGAELIESNTEDTATIENLSMIIRGAQTIQEITETLLGSGRSTEPEAIELGAFVLEVVKPFRARAMGRSIRIDCDIPQNTEVYASKTSVRMALSNILSNGLEAIEGDSGGRIHLSTRQGERRVGLAVSDNGPGISPAQQKKIFDPLHTTKATGSGLGLPVARQLLEDLHGKLELESQEGIGSTFIIWLPEAHGKNSNR
jgi:signal transduction histidine kinase